MQHISFHPTQMIGYLWNLYCPFFAFYNTFMKIVIIGIINAAEYINEGNMKHEWRGERGQILVGQMMSRK